MIVIYTDDTTRVSLHVEPDGTDVPTLVLRSIASLPAAALSAGSPQPTAHPRRVGPVTALVLAMVAAAGGYIAAPRSRNADAHSSRLRGPVVGSRPAADAQHPTLAATRVGRATDRDAAPSACRR